MWGPLWAAGGFLFHHGGPWAARAQLPHPGLHNRLQGNLFDGLSICSLSFVTDLDVCRVFSLMHSNSSLQLQVRIPSPPHLS